MKRPPLHFLPVMLLLVLLHGCGQKGPLYLPDETQPPEATEPASR